MKMTGTDLLADAAIAAAKGYKDAEKHGAESGMVTGAKEFAKRRITSAVTGAIASKAVDSVPGISAGKAIIEDAISSGLEAAFGGVS